jgi:hypothetical protein
MTLPTAAGRAALTLILFAASVSAQEAPTADTPVAPPRFEEFVYVAGDTTANFNRTIADYFALRSQLQLGLPPVVVSDDPAAIRGGELALAALIRQARQDAEEGDIFTRVIGVEFRRALRLVMTAKTWASIMDDNPGSFSHRINGAYPKGRPLSTMPPSILTQLPSLPEGLEYRFLGRHLILLDVSANMILDRMRYAIQCSDCGN